MSLSTSQITIHTEDYEANNSVTFIKEHCVQAQTINNKII